MIHKVTYKELEDIRKLHESEKEKFSNRIENLIEETCTGQKQYTKLDDPTKKIKKEDHLKFKKDLKQFKIDQGLDETKKVFYIDPDNYPFLKEEMVKRGWVENPDVNSSFFDMKYTAAFKNVDVTCLYPGQLINHAIGSGAFCRKIGLTRYLRGSIWEKGVDADLFYPRSYAMLDNAGLFNFVQDFKGVEAYNRLVQMLKPENRINEYSEENFTTFIELATMTTCVIQRVNALTSLNLDLHAYEINAGLLDILDAQQGKVAANSFLLNKNAVRKSKLGEYGFVPKEDFIREFLDNNKKTPTTDLLQRLYKEVKID